MITCSSLRSVLIFATVTASLHIANAQDVTRTPPNLALRYPAHLGVTLSQETDETPGLPEITDPPTSEWDSGGFDFSVTFQGAAGVIDNPGEDASAFGAFGVNLASEIVPGLDGLAVQAGAMINRRESDAEENYTFGVFSRNTFVFTDSVSALGALLIDYRRTVEDGDLWGLRLRAGATVMDTDTVSFVARVPFNQDTVRRTAATRSRQRLLPRTDFEWAHVFTDSITSNVSLGYQYGDVDSVVLGAAAALEVFPQLEIVPQGEVNFDGDFVVGIGFVFNTGVSVRTESIDLASEDEVLRPFPVLDSLKITQETRR